MSTGPGRGRPGLVSVVIPTHNRARLLPEAIDSVLAQTYGNVEIIVVDDGSIDETPSALEPYRDRIVYLRQENRGRSAARNAGIAVSSGEYLAFLDSDDVFLPDKLTTQVGFLVEHPDVDVVYGHGYILTDRGIEGPLPPALLTPVTSDDPMVVLKRLLRRSLFPPHLALIRTSALDPNQLFDESLEVLEDWDFWLRLGLRGAAFRYQHDVVASYRWYPGNTPQGIRALAAAGPVICGKVVARDLDRGLAENLRQYFRLRHLDAILATRSPVTILSALRVILWPGRTFSFRGALLLLLQLLALPARPARFVAKSLRRRYANQARSRVPAVSPPRHRA